MKKYSLLMGLMCAALSITSCSKDNTETFDKPKGYEFELYAAPQTRTEVDGLDMKWSANDAMNVFHALPGTTNYSANDKFTVSDIAGGVFKGTITDTEFDPNGTYDWYVLYPYKSQKTTPTLDEAYFGIGSYATSVQTQKGINNQDHICGVDIPLYGKVTNTTGSPSLQMHHIATLFRINVTNTGSADLNVTSITLTSASENLIGTYYLDITGAAPVLTSSGDKYVSKTAALNVTDGIVAPDATGSFYLATRAFTAPEGEQLTLAVTANGETVEKVATLSKETTFAAGKINKLNVDIEGKEVVGLSLPFTDNFNWANNGETEETKALALAEYPEGKYSATEATYKGIGGLKVGSGSKRGYFTTTTLDLSKEFSVIVNAKQYGSDDSTLAITIGETIQTADLSDTAQDYVFNFEPQGNKATVEVKVEGKRGYIYRIDIVEGQGTVATPLDTPTGLATEVDGNMVLVGWKPVAGATSYTVSFEPATIEPRTVLHDDAMAEYSEIFENLDYATEYTVSVVANPADTENYKASAPATATFITGENPNPEPGFEPGDYVIMAYVSNTFYALSSAADGSRLAASEIAYDGTSETVAATDETIVWTIAQSGSDYTIQNNAQYLSWPGNDDNAASLSDTEYALSITQNEDGTTYTIASVATPERILAKNNDPKYGFAFYKGSGAKELYLVKADRNAVSLTTTDKSVSFAAAGESKDITFTATNLGSNQVFAAISGDGAAQFTASVGNGAVTVTALENTETTAKTATLTLYIAASEGGEHLAEATVELTQSGYSSATTYTLDFIDKEGQTGCRNYTTTWTKTIGSYSWSIANFNNNDNGWDFIRCGRSKYNSVASITTSWAISEAISKVVVTVDSYVFLVGCTSELQIASDENFTQNVQTIPGEMAKGDMTYNIPVPTGNCYYRLVYTCPANSNGYIQISKVIYTTD